jgi:DNA helicase II / ATP-dependent DNA helicase PcrA
MTVSTDFKLSIYQQGLIEFMNNPDEKNAICNAVAGSGKSTTLLYVALSLQNQGIDLNDMKIVVFGKQNSLDLIAKFGQHWKNSICTLHSLGYSFCKEILGEIKKVDADKYRQISKELGYLGTKKNPGILIETSAIGDESQFFKLYDLARHQLVTFEFNETDLLIEQLKELVIHYNLDKIYNFELIGKAMQEINLKGLNLAKTENILDYNDMIYLPTAAYPFWMSNWFTRYKYTLIDECQDLNPCQTQMSLHLADRLLYVGDPRQSIYGFAGAGIDSYDSIKEKAEALELPLSVCYRCPASHINLVNRLFPEISIQSTTNAKNGKLEQIDVSNVYHKQGDLILSRKTNTLIKYCLKLISQGIPAFVKGRNIGKGLIKEVDAIYKRAFFTLSNLIDETPNFDDFLSYVEDYQQFKQKQWRGLDNYDRLCEILDDKLKSIAVIYEGLNTDDYLNGFKGLKEAVNKLFSDSNGFITLCTVHRAKGLEADSVYILEPDDMPLSWRHQKEWEYQQELNILYVALTRSKSKLYLVGDASWLKVEGKK